MMLLGVFSLDYSVPKTQLLLHHHHCRLQWPRRYETSGHRKLHLGGSQGMRQQKKPTRVPKEKKLGAPHGHDHGP